MPRVVDEVPRMTLDEFEKRLPEETAKFIAATRHSQAEGADGFVGEKYERRTLVDWFNELAAYHLYHELSQKLEAIRAADRRRNRERRRIG